MDIIASDFMDLEWQAWKAENPEVIVRIGFYNLLYMLLNDFHQVLYACAYVYVPVYTCVRTCACACL